MVKFLPLDILGLSYRIPQKIKNTLYHLNKMTDDRYTSSAQILQNLLRQILGLSQKMYSGLQQNHLCVLEKHQNAPISLVQEWVNHFRTLPHIAAFFVTQICFTHVFTSSFYLFQIENPEQGLYFSTTRRGGPPPRFAGATMQTVDFSTELCYHH